MPITGRERRIRAEARKRGIVRVRTKSLPNSEYAHVYIVRKAGRRGGHTVMGEPQRKKG